MVQGAPKRRTRCPEQDMGRVVQVPPVSNGFGTTTETFSNTISIPLVIAGGLELTGSSIITQMCDLYTYGIDNQSR